jgi:hypothetical protein
MDGIHERPVRPPLIVEDVRAHRRRAGKIRELLVRIVERQHGREHRGRRRQDKDRYAH